MNTKYLSNIIAITLSILLLSCNTEIPKATSSTNVNDVSIIKSINLDISLNNELFIIDSNGDNTTRSIKIIPDVTKFVTPKEVYSHIDSNPVDFKTQLDGQVGANIPMFLLLQTPSGRYGAKIKGKILGEKNIKIESDIDKFEISKEKSSTFKAKLFIGGEYNESRKTLQFDNTLKFMYFLQDWVYDTKGDKALKGQNLDAFTGNIPFASDLVDLIIDEKGNLSLDNSDKIDNISKIVLRPTGMIFGFNSGIFIKTKDEHNLSYLNAKVIYKSNELVSRGEIVLDKTEHYWRPLTPIGSFQILESKLIYNEEDAYREAHIYIWGDQVSTDIDFSKNGAERQTSIRYYYEDEDERNKVDFIRSRGNLKKKITQGSISYNFLPINY